MAVRVVHLTATVLLLVAFVPFIGGFGSARASAVTEETDARNRIGVAGRQRMLTQQIVRNTCFVMAGINKDHFVAKTEAAVQQFDTALSGLRSGDENLGLRAETNAEILAQLEEVEALWSTLGAAARQIAAGDVHPVPMQQMIRLNLEANDLMQRLSSSIRKARGAGVPDAKLEGAIELFGQQRMLTQKASKEVCFLILDIKEDGASGDIGATIALFDDSMQMLREGAPEAGIIAPPNRQIRMQVERADKAWNRFKDLLQRFEDDPDRPDSEKSELAYLSDLVLREIDLAAWMYTER